MAKIVRTPSRVTGGITAAEGEALVKGGAFVGVNTGHFAVAVKYGSVEQVAVDEKFFGRRHHLVAAVVPNKNKLIE